MPKGEKSKIKTEILFIERCLALLKPGGRLGIVLPEGIFNNPSLAYVREFCEDRAFIRAVVSLPQETFYSSGASVKASLLFMQKFTQKEKAEFERRRRKAETKITRKYAAEIKKRTDDIERQISALVEAEDAGGPDQTVQIKSLSKELNEFEKQMKERMALETRAFRRTRHLARRSPRRALPVSRRWLASRECAVRKFLLRRHVVVNVLAEDQFQCMFGLQGQRRAVDGVKNKGL